MLPIHKKITLLNSMTASFDVLLTISYHRLTIIFLAGYYADKRELEHRCSWATNSKRNECFALTPFDAIASAMKSPQTPKQEFFSIRQVVKTSQQREHLTSSFHSWPTNVCVYVH